MHPDGLWIARLTPATLSGRLFVLIAVLLVTSLLVGGGLLHWLRAQDAAAMLDRHAEQQAEQLSDRIKTPLRRRDIAAIETLLLTTISGESIALVQVIDNAGQVLAEAERLQNQGFMLLHRPLILEVPQSQPPPHRIGDNGILWKSVDGMGWVRMEYSLQAMLARQADALWQSVAIILTISVLALLMLAVVLPRMLRPLQRLRTAANELVQHAQPTIDLKSEPQEISAVGRALSLISLRLQDLDAGEQRYEQLIATVADRLPCVLWIYSADGQTLQYLSPAYAELWGRPRAPLFSNLRSWQEAVWPVDQERLQSLLSLDDVSEVEYRISRPDGSAHWIKDECFTVFDEHGQRKSRVRISVDMGPVVAQESAVVVSNSRAGNNVESSWPDDRPLHILVADDNDINRALLASLIEERGAKVVTVDDGKAAVEQALEDRYDAIILDIHMPNMSGIDAAVEIRRGESGRRTPIIALTADVMIEQREHLAQYGIDALLVKPISEKKLWQVLQQWCQSRAVAMPPPVLSELEEAPVDPDMLPAIDGEFGMRQAGGCQDTADEMFEKFLRMLPEQQLVINRAHAAGDLRLLNDQVHSLHGSTCYCGVPALRYAADRLERTIKSGSSSRRDIARSVAILNTQIDRLLIGGAQQRLHDRA